MDKEVHVDHPPGGGGRIGKDEPAVVEGEQVVDPVQGNQLPLAEQHKGRVQQFDGLGEREEEVPDVEAVVLQKNKKNLVKCLTLKLCKIWL